MQNVNLEICIVVAEVSGESVTWKFNFSSKTLTSGVGDPVANT